MTVLKRHKLPPKVTLGAVPNRPQKMNFWNGLELCLKVTFWGGFEPPLKFMFWGRFISFKKPPLEGLTISNGSFRGSLEPPLKSNF